MEKEVIDAQFVFEGGERWMEPDEGREQQVTGEGCCTGPASGHARAQREHSRAPAGLETLSVAAKERDFGYKRGHFYSEHSELAQPT